MATINNPGRPDKRTESEKIADANKILNVLVHKKLIPLYDSFRIDELINMLEGDEKQIAYGIENYIESILDGYDLIETHPNMNYKRRLTQSGREMTKFDYFFMWEESRNKHNHISNIHQTFNAGRDIIGSGNVESSIKDSFLSESTISSNVNIMPNNIGNAVKIKWYSKPLFIYLIWPILAGLIIAYFIFVFKWNK